MSGITDFIIIHYKSLSKEAFWIMIYAAILIMIPAFFCNGLYNWSIDYHHQYQIAHGQIPAPTIAAAAGATVQAGPTPTPTPMEVLTVDVDALKRNVQYPATFSRDPDKDPAGAYYNMALNVGLGPYPGVYIVPDVWKKAGGRVVQTNAMPTSAFYYTVYTHGGSSSSVIYDRVHNIVYTIEKDPAIMQ